MQHFTDGQPHQLGMYLLDWARVNRIETVSILDATTGATLDTRTASNFGNGQYLVWVRILAQADQPFLTKPISDSRGSRSGIPDEADH